MKMSESHFCLIVLLIVIATINQIHADQVTCYARSSNCFLRYLQCPAECPSASTVGNNKKVCFIDCNSPICKAECKNKKPNCNGPGAACLDPRFIGADGRVFYFHGKSNEDFSLVSDTNLQINAHFIGLRPAGRPRDSTWIQGLGILFDSHSFSVEAAKATIWDQEVDHLKFFYNGEELVLPQGHQSMWESLGSEIRVARSSMVNSAIITLPEIAEISVNVVPITKEDDRIHNYQIPNDDCFAHLEVHFRFYRLSAQVEGVLGKTYQPDFINPAKVGVAMPVVGGEDKYRTSSLMSPDCKLCIFSPAAVTKETPLAMDLGELDCTGMSGSGAGIVCKK